MSDRDSGHGLFYFLAGAAVGAVAGILLAPKSGEETREQLTEWMKERREKGAELLHKVKDESLIKKEAIAAAARAAKDAYRETNKHSHDGVNA